jgi:hypothetical protein
LAFEHFKRIYSVDEIEYNIIKEEGDPNGPVGSVSE